MILKTYQNINLLKKFADNCGLGLSYFLLASMIDSFTRTMGTRARVNHTV